MTEEVRNIDENLICCIDADRGLIVHTHHKEMVRICLPVGGEVSFIRSNGYTLVRRDSPNSFYWHSDHYDFRSLFAG